jgi:lipopolysaccharide export system protein LptA
MNGLAFAENSALNTFLDIIASGRRTAAILVLVAATAVAGAVAAQPKVQQQQLSPQQPSGPPSALQGFSQNRDQPVKITAAELQVHDKEKVAVFSGDVHLVQGDTTMRSGSLVVYYDDQPPPPAPPPKSGKGPVASAQLPPPQQSQQIRKVEAKGNVIVTQKDQIATGDLATFDMRLNTVTMSGNVIITRGPNVLKGDGLVVNMTTGESAMTCSNSKGGCAKRVEALIIPGSMKQGPAGGPLPVPGRKP